MRYLRLNGKRVTKFDLGRIIDSLYPAWHSNAWLMEDVLSYDEYVNQFVTALSQAPDYRLERALSFYYEEDYLRKALNDVQIYRHNNKNYGTN